MSATCISRQFRTSPERVYRALLDSHLIAQWRVPTGMQCQIHQFDAREGGAFRVSLTYDAPSARGKSSARTDTYHGHFATLVPTERVVEGLEFETTDPSLTGRMRITTTLSRTADGTHLEAVYDGLPSGLSAEANAEGWRQSLAKLAALLEENDPKG